MRIDHQAWRSPHTGTAMPILRFGERGLPILYLPTSGGDHTEFERYGLPDECRARIESGQIQIFTVDAGGPASLFNQAIAPQERMARYVRYENYVAHEALPWIVGQTGQGPPVVVGASYGAFVAANLLYRHPRAVNTVCGIGGVYGMWHCLDGFHDDAVYFHTPLEYLPRLEDVRIIAAIRSRPALVMYAAEDDSWVASSYQLARVLRGKELPFEINVWKSPANHHEHWWRQQFAAFLKRLD